MKYDKRTVNAVVEWVENNVSSIVAEEVKDNFTAAEERKQNEDMVNHAARVTLQFLKRYKKPQSNYKLVKYIVKQLADAYPGKTSQSLSYELALKAINRLKRWGKIKSSHKPDSNYDQWSLAAK